MARRAFRSGARDLLSLSRRRQRRLCLKYAIKCTVSQESLLKSSRKNKLISAFIIAHWVTLYVKWRDCVGG
jgi:hypothetical protein